MCILHSTWKSVETNAYVTEGSSCRKESLELQIQTHGWPTETKQTIKWWKFLLFSSADIDYYAGDTYSQ
jgi:hypothetical protein